MKKTIATLVVALFCINVHLFAQDLLADTNFSKLETRVNQNDGDLKILKRLKVNGWIQAQYQHIDTMGAANVAGGTFGTYANQRMMLRRGRVKFTYEHDYAQYVLQIDVVDPTLTAPLNSTTTPTSTASIPFAVNVRDFFVKLNAPFFKPLTLTVGMQNRPFGFEVSQSSQYRETPERSRFVQNLFPNERDLGAMVTLQGPKSSPLHIFKINAGMFNGSGIARDFDSKMDFIGQLIMTRSTKNEAIQYGVGVSYYKGSTLNTDSVIYSEISNNTNGSPVFNTNKNASNIGTYVNREYLGVDAQVSIDNPLGITTLRCEYTQGTQPGSSSSTRSTEIMPTGATYVRSFQAGYFYFVHKIAKLPIQVVYKYDVYDPNTKVKGAEISAGGKYGTGDIKYTTQGVGLNYLVSSNLKFMFYYDQVTNESTSFLGTKAADNYTYDKRDNIFTARVQYRF